MNLPIDPPERKATPLDLLPGVLALAGLVALVYVATFMPGDLSELPHLALSEMEGSGLGNPITAVLLDFRAFDTLLETAVLVLALTGLWGLTPGQAWAGVAVNLRTYRAAEPQLLVLLKVLVPLVLLSAFYLLWLGADEPGGAFQAGTLLAAVGILLVLCRVLPLPAHGDLLVRTCVAIGFLAFALAGLLTALLGPGFLDYPEGWTKAIILPVEAALTITIATALFMLSSGLPEHGSVDG